MARSYIGYRGGSETPPPTAPDGYAPLTLEEGHTSLGGNGQGCVQLRYLGARRTRTAPPTQTEPDRCAVRSLAEVRLSLLEGGSRVFIRKRRTSRCAALGCGRHALAKIKVPGKESGLHCSSEDVDVHPEHLLRSRHPRPPRIPVSRLPAC